MKTGVWLHETPLSPEEKEGFVYASIVTLDGRTSFYFGKKRYRLGGKKKGKQSDWMRYKTSSRKVKSLLEHGAEMYQVILAEYGTRSGISWGEVWTQATARVVESDLFLNQRIDGVFFNVKEPISESHERLLKELLVDPFGLIARLESDNG